MTNQAEQKIIIYCEPGKTNTIILEHGIRMARIFSKELCLFSTLVTRDKREREKVQNQLSLYLTKMKPLTAGLTVSSLTLRGRLHETVEKLADDYDAIMLIVSRDNIFEKLMALQQSSIPFLFIGDGCASGYDRILMTGGASKAVKSCALWATWFARFNQAHIEILTAECEHEESRHQAGKNMDAIRELIEDLNLKIQVSHFRKPAATITETALQKGKDENFGLLIICNHEHSSVDDLFALPEAEMIEKAGELPVLCINSNRDMYILCD